MFAQTSHATIPSLRHPMPARSPSAVAAPRRCHDLIAEDVGAQTPPMHWWRTRIPDAVTGKNIPLLRRCIRGLMMLDEPSWPDAEKGDVAAATGILMRLVQSGKIGTPAFDLVATALFIPAICGDATAQRVLALVRQARAEAGCSDETTLTVEVTPC